MYHYFRFWSKKYPICVELHKDQLDFQEITEKTDKSSGTQQETIKSNLSLGKNKAVLQVIIKYLTAIDQVF